MRHIPAIIGYLILAVILALIQYPVSGVYGRIMFWPIYCILMSSYVVFQIKNKADLK